MSQRNPHNVNWLFNEYVLLGNRNIVFVSISLICFYLAYLFSHWWIANIFLIIIFSYFLLKTFKRFLPKKTRRKTCRCSKKEFSDRDKKVLKILLNEGNDNETERQEKSLKKITAPNITDAREIESVKKHFEKTETEEDLLDKKALKEMSENKEVRDIASRILMSIPNILSDILIVITGSTLVFITSLTLNPLYQTPLLMALGFSAVAVMTFSFIEFIIFRKNKIDDFFKKAIMNAISKEEESFEKAKKDLEPGPIKKSWYVAGDIILAAYTIGVLMVNFS